MHGLHVAEGQDLLTSEEHPTRHHVEAERPVLIRTEHGHAHCKGILAGPAAQERVAGARVEDQEVVSGTAIPADRSAAIMAHAEKVTACTAAQHVVPTFTAGEEVIPGFALDQVVALAASEHVAPQAPADPVLAAAP